MTFLELRTTLSLASIYALRLLGLFMILPIFSLYAPHLAGATPTLVGLALGIYGLTQGLLQIPFGTWSDRYGRKLLMAIGLIFFIIGSIIAALSHSIIHMIIGRALQGAGAIGSVTMALVADSTRDSQRTKAMAVIGITIGLSFTLAMLIGPLLYTKLDMPSIFWLIAGLGIIALMVLFTLVPTQQQQTNLTRPFSIAELKILLLNANLLRLNIGIFILHAIFTASFMVIPTALQNQAQINATQQWAIYLPALLLASVLTFPLIISAERSHRAKLLFLAAIILLTIIQPLSLLLLHSGWGCTLYLFIFFLAFTLLEALLPSLSSKLAPAQYRGTTMGIYSSSQFLGIFCGGLIGGWLYGHYNMSGVFLACGLVGLIWLVLANSMQIPTTPQHQS